MTIDAIDISKWQGDLNFGLLKEDVRFVIIRVQHGYTINDAKHVEYEQGCINNNIPFGSYAYFAALNPNDAIAEANSFADRMNPNSLFCAVDVKEVSTTDPNQLKESIQAFVDRLKDKGITKIGLYSGEYFFNTHHLETIDNIEWYWIAKYGTNNGLPQTEPNVSASISLWQYTSNGAEYVHGISSEGLDLNKLTGYDKTISYFTLENNPAPSPSPSPDFPFIPPLPNTNINEIYFTIESLDLYKTPDTINLIEIKIDSYSPVYLIPNIKKNNLVYVKYIDNNNVTHYGFVSFDKIAKKEEISKLQEQKFLKKYYEVQDGDSLTHIAKINDISIEKLRLLNGMGNSIVLSVGDQIRVK